jgi:hypothetical protein
MAEHNIIVAFARDNIQGIADKPLGNICLLFFAVIYLMSSSSLVLSFILFIP